MEVCQSNSRSVGSPLAHLVPMDGADPFARDRLHQRRFSAEVARDFQYVLRQYARHRDDHPDLAVGFSERSFRTT